MSDNTIKCPNCGCVYSSSEPECPNCAAHASSFGGSGNISSGGGRNSSNISSETGRLGGSSNISSGSSPRPSSSNISSGSSEPSNPYSSYRGGSSSDSSGSYVEPATREPSSKPAKSPRGFMIFYMIVGLVGLGFFGYVFYNEGCIELLQEFFEDVKAGGISYYFNDPLSIFRTIFWFGLPIFLVVQMIISLVHFIINLVCVFKGTLHPHFAAGKPKDPNCAIGAIITVIAFLLCQIAVSLAGRSTPPSANYVMNLFMGLVPYFGFLIVYIVLTIIKNVLYNKVRVDR